MNEPTIRDVMRQLRERTKYLRNLTVQVEQFLALMDSEMKKPSDAERGRRIARACNALEMANDGAKLWGLPRRKSRRTLR